MRGTWPFPVDQTDPGVQAAAWLVLALGVGGLFFAQYLRMKDNRDDAFAVTLVAGVLVLMAASVMR